jgi:PEP-CTERM motif-containing protein
MCKGFNVFKNGAAIFALALSTGGSGWAGLSSCGAAPGTTLATLLGVADNGNTPANGCGQTDLGFNAFTTPTNTGTNTSPTTSQIELSTSGGVIGSSGVTITPVNALFTFTGGNSLAANPASSIISSFNDLGAPVSGQSPPTNGDRWAVDGLGLTFNASTSVDPNHPETVEVRESFCLGQTSFTCLATANNFGYLQILETIATTGATSFADQICTPGSGGCTITTATTATLAILFANQYNFNVATQLSIDMTRPNNSANTLSLNTISETWDQVATPEPSTLLLLGSALAGLVVIRKRKLA